MKLQLLTPAVRGAWLEQIRGDIAKAEHFVLITAFATSDGIALLEPAMRTCLDAGGQGTLVLALDRQHFNAAAVFEKLATLVEEFPNKLEVRVVREGAGLLHAKAVFAKAKDGTATLLVGSANLTEKAYTQNHELGLWVDLLGPPEISNSFQLFVRDLCGTPCDAAALRRLAGSLGDGKRPDPAPNPAPPAKKWEELIGPTAARPMEPVALENFVSDWLRAGYIVGRGRRGLGVLVIRTPGKRLEGVVHLDVLRGGQSRRE